MSTARIHCANRQECYIIWAILVCEWTCESSSPLLAVSTSPRCQADKLEYGPRAAEQSQPTLRQWAISEEADIVIDHALQLLHELSFPRQTEVLHGPPAAFTAILCLWTCAIADVGRADVVLERFSSLVAEGERDGVKTASGMLSVGARYLARSGAWRIGAAYALVLTKLKI